MPDGFVHLHNHMEGSHSDSALRVTSALDRVVELGMNAFAITDHGEMAMVPTFAREAEKRGIKPLIGMEAYFVENARENISRRINDRFHLTILAMNPEGYSNLVRIASRSWSENCLMQKLGLVDWKLLEEHSAGLIILSGCLAGPVSWSYFKDAPAEAERFYGKFADLFGDRYYVEIYNHESTEENKAVPGLTNLAKRFGRKTVLTNDCHYLHAEDWTLHDTLIKTRFGKATDFALPYHEYYIKSPAQMRALGFPDDACDTTIEIAERITLTPRDMFRAPSSGRVETAFLPERPQLDYAMALSKAAAVQKRSRREQDEIARLSPDELSRTYPHEKRVAEGLAGLLVKPHPDLRRVAAAPNLSAHVPLRRSERLLFTMWTEEEVRAAGAEVHPVEDFPDLVPLAKAAECYHQGLGHYKRKHLSKARTAFQKALEYDPDLTNARYQLGLVEYYDDQMNDALRHFEEVLRREPDFERLPFLNSYLGWALFRTQQTDRAISHFRRSVAEREIPGSLLGLGLALERANDFAGAEKTLLRLVEIAPDFPRLATAQKALERLSRRGSSE